MSVPAPSAAAPWAPPAGEAPGTPPRPSHWLKVLPFIGPVVLFIIWDLAVRLGLIKAILLPLPADTVATLITGLAGGTLLVDFAVTVWRTLQAFHDRRAGRGAAWAYCWAATRRRIAASNS